MEQKGVTILKGKRYLLLLFVFGASLLWGVGLPAAAASPLSVGLHLSDNETLWQGELLADHGCYGVTITDADAFPLSFVQSCITENKTPIVTLLPQTEDSFPSSQTLHTLARQCGRSKDTVYLNLYPYSPALAQNRLVYQANWAQAAAIFRQEAPNAQLIWTLPAEDVQYAFSFAPRETDYDLLGISCHGTPKETALTLPFCLQFLSVNSQKPLALSSLGISHYETATHSYTTEETAAAITELYTLCQVTPALRFLLYDNTNHTIALPPGVTASNYEISADDTLRKAYQKALSSH